ALRVRRDEVSPAAVAAAHQADDPRHAARRDRIHGAVHAAGRYQLEDRSHRARLRRIGERAEFLDAQVRAGAPSGAAAHVRLLEQDVGGYDLPRRTGAAGGRASRSAHRRAQPDARRESGRVRTDRAKGADRPAAPARSDSAADRVLRLRLRPRDFKVRHRRREGSRNRAAAALSRGGARRPEDARRSERSHQAGILRLADKATKSTKLTKLTKLTKPAKKTINAEPAKPAEIPCDDETRETHEFAGRACATRVRLKPDTTSVFQSPVPESPVPESAVPESPSP